MIPRFAAEWLCDPEQATYPLCSAHGDQASCFPPGDNSRGAGGVKLAEGLERARPAQGFTVVLCLRHDLASGTNRLAPCSHPASEAVAARTHMAGG